MIRPPLTTSPIDEICHADITKQTKLADQADQDDKFADRSVGLVPSTYLMSTKLIYTSVGVSRFIN